MDKKEKINEKKENITFYFIKIFIIFIVIFFAQQFIISELIFNFMYAASGKDAIMEMIWAILALIVVLIFKDSHIFSQKKEKIRAGFKLAWPLFVIEGLFAGIGIVSIVLNGGSIPVICNSLILYICVGIVEEFLCRGWLLNEFF